MRKAIAAGLAASVLVPVLGVLAAQSLAQTAPARVRGTIENVDGPVLSVAVREAGRETGKVQIRLADNAQVFAVASGTLADIKPGDFIGAGAVPLADGSQKAIQVMIFAESMRGLGEGHRPWNSPGTTMTNATVAETVARTEGPVVTVKYPGGEQKIVVVPDTVIRKIVASDRSELRAGAAVSASVTKKPDGTLETARVSVGRDGVEP